MRRRFAAALLVVAAGFVAGCGSEDFPNNPRPAAAINISARINNKQVVFAPSRAGAGLAVITISNQSSDPVGLDLSGPSEASTAEIAAGGVGTLRVALEQGDYSVKPTVDSIPGGNLKIGPPRSTAQNDLLLP